MPSICSALRALDGRIAGSTRPGQAGIGRITTGKGRGDRVAQRQFAKHEIRDGGREIKFHGERTPERSIRNR